MFTLTYYLHENQLVFQIQRFSFFELPQGSSELPIVHDDSRTFFIALTEALLKSHCFASVNSVSVTFLKTGSEELQLELTASEP